MTLKKTKASIIFLPIILNLLLIAIIAPWSTKWGASYSTKRVGLIYLHSSLGILIPALISLRLLKGLEKLDSEDLAVRAGIVSAAYAVGGLATGVNIDISALVASFSAVYYGGSVVFLALILGFFVRWLIGGAVWIPLPVLGPAVGFIDASIWAVNAYVYWRVARGRRSWLKVAIALIVMVLIHFYGSMICFALPGNPMDAFKPYLVYSLLSWYPTSILFITAGTIIGEAAVSRRYHTDGVVRDQELDL